MVIPTRNSGVLVAASAQPACGTTEVWLVGLVGLLMPAGGLRGPPRPAARAVARWAVPCGLPPGPTAVARRPDPRPPRGPYPGRRPARPGAPPQVPAGPG